MKSPWASCQIRKNTGYACAGNAGNVFPRRQFQKKLLYSDPGMHHGTCVTHVPWCMSGSLTCGDGENRSRHSRRMHIRNFAYLARGPLSCYIIYICHRCYRSLPTLLYQIFFTGLNRYLCKTVSNHRSFHCLFHRMFLEYVKVNIKTPPYWPFVGGIHRWPVVSPHKVASNAPNVSMSWRHHVLEGEINK